MNLKLFSKEGSKKIRQSGKRLLHLGLIVIGIKGLVRKSLGAKVLIAFLEAYTDYGSERDDIKPRGKRFPLETIEKKLLLDDGRFSNLTAHDP